ncbi:hypothetical protein [Heterosigma akashiwo virus 01]|jgi:hypothetical protein|uniref:Uncharacterized protein n=1 Tax=Heterosigma akashiwo virus 01 TaxID=97195 RepID=A0A1C9C594_HAV01|nr:hypothetical protein D1R72_gp124 [Heterosigma akashiwo virus 01]AOM63455.1 hypothetical protein [Heterosigma akashiwo virus 01]
MESEPFLNLFGDENTVSFGAKSKRRSVSRRRSPSRKRSLSKRKTSRKCIRKKKSGTKSCKKYGNVKVSKAGTAIIGKKRRQLYYRGSSKTCWYKVRSKVTGKFIWRKASAKSLKKSSKRQSVKRRSTTRRKSYARRSSSSGRRSAFGYCSCGAQDSYSGFGGVHGNASNLNQMYGPVLTG